MSEGLGCFSEDDKNLSLPLKDFNIYPDFKYQ